MCTCHQWLTWLCPNKLCINVIGDSRGCTLKTSTKLHIDYPPTQHRQETRAEEQKSRAWLIPSRIPGLGCSLIREPQQACVSCLAHRGLRHQGWDNQNLIEMGSPATLALLCTTAKTEKQVNCRSTGEGTHNGAHVHHGIHLNHKEGINAKSSVRKARREDHSKWSKRHRERLVSYDVTSRCNLKMDTNELTAQRHRLTDSEKKLLVIKI